MITQSELIEMFDYKDGQLLRKNNITKQKKLAIGSVSVNGYIETSINYKRYLLHRLIWLYHYGYFPKCIDHIDGNRRNNRIENLREATFSQNALNMKIRSNKKIPVKNVYSCSGGYEVKFCMHGVKKRFGTFRSVEDAQEFAIQYRKNHHKEFARHK